ncbi:MAG: type VI secretion system protein VasJ [Oleispira sp.]|jgi:type VI secretion system protein VasJ
MDLQHPLLAIGSTAIQGESPCGINAKYEPSFEALEAELAKQESLSSDTVDWKEVKALATDLLQNTTKDYLVASYLTHALTITEGYTGLLVGVKILESFTENFWQASFPPAKRLRARKTAIEWLVEKTSHYIEISPPTNADNEVIIELANSVKNLDLSLADKMEAQSPSMAELNRNLKRLKQSAEFELKANVEKAPPPVVIPEPAPIAAQEVTNTLLPETPAPTTLQPVEPIAAISAPASSTHNPSSNSVPISNTALANDADAKKLYKQVQDALRQLAEFHAEQKTADPKRYRYSRAALWDSLEKLPPNKDSKTQLPKPAVDKFKKLQELFEQGDFIAVLNQAEKSASKMPYWFDGQRLIANSLAALGGEFTKAAEALTLELKQFLTRLPSIINLCYSDGTPFADEQTLLWINTQVLCGDQDDSSGQQNDEIHEAFLEAQKLASSGKLTEGLGFLKKVSTQNLRDDFRIKLATAELVSQSGQAKVAIPLLERLITETKRINAIDWETDFTIKAYSILVKAYEKLEDDDAAQKQQQRMDAFDQLCWFDPTAVAE